MTGGGVRELGAGEGLGVLDEVCGLVDKPLDGVYRLAPAGVEAVAVEGALSSEVAVPKVAHLRIVLSERASGGQMIQAYNNTPRKCLGYRTPARVVLGDLGGSLPVRARTRASVARLAAHQAFSAASLMSPAAMRWMAALCMRRASAKMGVGSAEVVVMGFSLGGMIARVGRGIGKGDTPL